jgi:DNA-binding NarL/FixJ family response regulator
MAQLKQLDGAAAAVLEQRTCCRCGKSFRTVSANICSACRAPTVTFAEIKRRSVGKELTRRQKQVAALVTQGLSNKEIAFELKLAYGTVKEYLSSMFVRLGVRNRTELALRWSSMNSSSS